jgi:hypothetical protein
MVAVVPMAAAPARQIAVMEIPDVAAVPAFAAPITPIAAVPIASVTAAPVTAIVRVRAGGHRNGRQ